MRVSCFVSWSHADGGRLIEGGKKGKNVLESRVSGDLASTLNALDVDLHVRRVVVEL